MPYRLAIVLNVIKLGWIMGFEPMASRATIWRANQQRYTHHKLHRSIIDENVPEGIRTPDNRLRRPVLYPTELLTRIYQSLHNLHATSDDIAEAGDGNRTHVSSLEG